jgi:hypothetical protein
MFFTYNQNNSGGDFDIDERAGIAHYVLIEADSASEADERAEEIGLYFNGVDEGRDCECCGDRWYSPASYDIAEVPSVYGKPVVRCSELPSSYRWDLCAVHPKDGPFYWSLVAR